MKPHFVRLGIIATIGISLVVICAPWRTGIAAPIITDSYNDISSSVDRKSSQPKVEYGFSGYAALENGEIEVAKSAFQKALSIDPQWVPALLGMAEVYSQLGDSLGAQPFVQQALELAPESVEVHIAQGRIQFRLGNLALAKTAFSRAARMRPRDSMRQVDLGDVHWAMSNNPRDGLPYYGSAIELDPQNSGAFYALGTAYAALSETEKAEIALRRSASLSPQNPLPFMTLGKYYAQQGDFDSALDSYAEVLDRQPKLFTALLSRGDLFMLTNDHVAAMAEYQKALTIVPDESSVWVRIASVHQYGGEYDNARRAYLKAIESDSKNALAFNNLAWMSASRGENLDEALRWAQNAVGLESNPHFSHTLAAVHRARGELDDAARILAHSIDEYPGRAENHYLLGVVLQEQGKVDSATQELRSALEIDSNFENAGDARLRLQQLNR